MQKKIFRIFFSFVILACSVGATGATAADHEPTRKMILGGRVGDSWHVLSQALAHFTNEDSGWLNLQVVATPGVSAGPEMAMKNYNKYIFISPFYSMMTSPDMKRMDYYDKDRIVGYCTSNTWVWITYDKSIKNAEDLIGKKVFVGRPGGSRTIFEEKILEAHGIKDKVKLLHGGYGGGANALRDGLADVAVIMIDYILPSSFKKGSFIEDLETRGPIYYINLMPKELQLEHDMLPLRIPPKALDPKTQPEAVYASVDPVFWCADARLEDDAIVREVAKVLYNNTEKFADWHAQGRGITKESLSTYVISMDRIHPAAKKFYEEKEDTTVKPLLDLLP
ncbi:MAG: hypothetical protein K9J79_03550 [Desulfobacteraceae bacterium]|nr:hypothetical protein [Desulfobacteraceae bacterium]